MIKLIQKYAFIVSLIAAVIAAACYLYAFYNPVLSD